MSNNLFSLIASKGKDQLVKVVKQNVGPQNATVTLRIKGSSYGTGGIEAIAAGGVTYAVKVTQGKTYAETESGTMSGADGVRLVKLTRAGGEIAPTPEELNAAARALNASVGIDTDATLAELRAEAERDAAKEAAKGNGSTPVLAGKGSK